MKIRNGFVSNSSSSSFVAVILKEDFDSIKSSLSIAEAAIIDAIGVENKELFGNDCVVFGYVSGNYSTLEYTEMETIVAAAEIIAEERGVSLPDDFDDELDNVFSDAAFTFETAVYKLDRDKRFTHSEDF